MTDYQLQVIFTALQIQNDVLGVLLARTSFGPGDNALQDRLATSSSILGKCADWAISPSGYPPVAGGIKQEDLVPYHGQRS